MNAKKFSDAMSELDSKYIDEALNYKKKAKKPVWVKWGAMAACLCLIVVAIITVPSMLTPQESDGGAGGTIADAPPMVYVNDTLYKQSTKQTSYNELKDDFVKVILLIYRTIATEMLRTVFRKKTSKQITPLWELKFISTAMTL